MRWFWGRKKPPRADSRLGSLAQGRQDKTLPQVEWVYVVRRHPQWGYTVILDNGIVEPSDDDIAYSTPFRAALSVPRDPDREVNVRVHRECLYHRRS